MVRSYIFGQPRKKHEKALVSRPSSHVQDFFVLFHAATRPLRVRWF